MSLRYKGGVISATPPTTTGGTSGTAKGVWTLQQQMQAQASSTWPLSPPTAVQVSRSLRFNSADSAYLDRTPGSAGNRQKYTYSAWVKKALNAQADANSFFSCGSSTGSPRIDWQFNASDQINIGFNNSGSSWAEAITTALFRDVSAWYHLVVSVDVSQATDSNRVKLYVNGIQQTLSGTFPAQNSDTAVNSAVLHTIGKYTASSANYFRGYITEVNFIDGQALTPSSFGQTNSTTGVWEPIQTVGYLTYGTNGFHLDFADNSGTTSTTLGKDTSGNGNNWTPNNFSVTAGTGNDSLVDTPTPYGTDTGAGGEVRGNYSTMNPIATRSGATFANGNLDVSTASSNFQYPNISTIMPNSGKWYVEAYFNSGGGSGGGLRFGVVNTSGIYDDFGATANGWCYLADGRVYNNGSASSYGVSSAPGDTLQIALDLDAGKIWYGKNGTWMASGAPATGSNPSQTFTASQTMAIAMAAGVSTAQVLYFNFGQRAFSYTAPSGFKALCTQNLPTPTVVQGDDYFNAVLYTGNGTSQSITGLDFSPDLVWTKSRSNAYNNTLVDSVRGVSKSLVSDSTAAEDDSAGSYVTAFNSNGFSVGTGTGSNGNGATYVAWTWRGSDSSAVSNTQGTITSTVSANTTSGFSVVTYTGNGTNGATIGHGLGATPSMIIVKNRTSAGYDWMVYQINLSANQNLKLNTTDTPSSWASGYITSPSSTIFTCTTGSGNIYNVNKNTDNYVAYCFAPIAGYSAFGSYTGNGSTDGPFVYIGFRPAYVLVKRTDTAENWVTFDNKRDAYNLTANVLLPNSSQAESSNTGSASMDLVSNGFKIRASTGINSGTWIYAAFAENPFKYALAR